ncbi:hypothetical protein MferCBS31731_005494 [Microsporum ferrugineum]
MPTMIYKFFIHALAFSLIEGAVIRRWSNGDTPDGTVGPGAAQGCQYWANSISPSDECGAILSYFDITEEPGIINTCTNFYQAVSGDNCDVIVNQNFKTFTLEDFIAWNPAVKSDCSGLWRGYYYCTGVPGTPTKPITTSTPKLTANPMNPQPQQPGRVKNCNKFYLVKSGDNCYNIEQKFSLSHNNFVRWNPDVKDDCSSLWQGYHMCVGVQGQPTRTSTTSAPQPTAHEPLYPGTIKECKNYHLVKSGDTCWSLQQSYNLDENKFKTLNPVLASDCSKLWLGYYICVSA